MTSSVGGHKTATIDLTTGRIAYELIGPESGQPIVLTPGGRFSKDVPGLRPLAEALAEGGMRVLIWDRPNSGSSDVQFWGESESHMRAEVLGELIQALGLDKPIIAGGSGGARDSLLTVARWPELASKLIMWNIVGGVYSTMNLAMVYVLPNIRAVHVGGIEAIIALPEWQKLIAANPRNEELIRAVGADEFHRVMSRWLESYVPRAGYSMPGVRDAIFGEIKVPTMIIRAGRGDQDHPTRTSLDVAFQIKGSKLVEPRWPEDAWEQGVVASMNGTGNIFDSWYQAAPDILAFAAER